MASWSELEDRALLAAAIACRYRWVSVATSLERDGYGARTAQACEHRLRLLLERERAYRREHLRRLIAQPIVRGKRTDALFRAAAPEAAKRADAASFPQMRRKESRSPDKRVVVAMQTLTKAQLLERAEHNEWKRALMAKAARCLHK
jgi:hypothetical protein